MEGSEITFLFQFGLIRDTVTVESGSLTLKSLKELACDFINTKCFDHGLSQLFDRLLLFKHDYNSLNVLQLITNTTEIIDETLVEVVLSGLFFNITSAQAIDDIDWILMENQTLSTFQLKYPVNRSLFDHMP